MPEDVVEDLWNGQFLGFYVEFFFPGEDVVLINESVFAVLFQQIEELFPTDTFYIQRQLVLGVDGCGDMQESKQK